VFSSIANCHSMSKSKEKILCECALYVAVMTDMAGGKRETETDWVISARHPR